MHKTGWTWPRLEIPLFALETGTSKKMRTRQSALVATRAHVDPSSTANQCYQQAAELSADLQDFRRSMELYQTVADWSLTSALTKYSVKEYWLRAALCSMALGVSICVGSRLCTGSRHHTTTFRDLCPKGRDFPFHPRSQICPRAHECVRGRRHRTLHWRSLSIRSSHQIGQLEDWGFVTNKEGA